MTLISVTAPKSGPAASRVLETLFLGNEINWGGFSALVGIPMTKSKATPTMEPDVSLFGNTNGGLQLARVALGNIRVEPAYEYFQPSTCSFIKTQPGRDDSNSSHTYLPGSFSSGSIFYSPHLSTFLLIYFDSLADSTFLVRYLDLTDLICPADGWTKGGRNGKGVTGDDVEALVRYGWSPAQTLYVPPIGGAGFNYDGFAHPEFFTRHYYTDWVSGGVQNDWYGNGVLQEADAGGDGKHLLLSWTSQEKGGTYGNGKYYQVMLAKVEFGDSPLRFSSATKQSSAEQNHGHLNALRTTAIWTLAWLFVGAL